MNNDQNKLLKALYDCAIACDECFSGSLKTHDIHMMAECMRLNIECAQICRLTGTFIAQGSEYAPELANVCCDVCAACAQECEKHLHDHCIACAQICRSCEEACDNYSHSLVV